MVIEQLFFTILAFGLFVYIFLKLFQENDTNYIGILVIEAVGIAMNFIAVFSKKEIKPFFTIIKYFCGIVIPICVVIIEKKQIPFIQFVNVIKSKIYLKLGNNKKAKEQLIKLIDKYPENYIGHKLLAEIYELEGGMRKAIDEYVQAIDVNKKDYDSYYKIAELLNSLEKQEEATEMLINLLNKKPDYYKATQLLGDILIGRELYKEAASVYHNALKYNPLSYDLNYNLGIAYTMLNDFQNAKIYYEKAADINSLSYNSKFSLAEIALIYKEIEEAQKYFMECLESDELSADSYYELSKISVLKGEKETAIKYANVAIDIDSFNIVPKIKKDPIFIPILARISIPFNLIENEKEVQYKLQPKEIKAKEHLQEMFDITRNIGYDNLDIMKKYNENENEISQNYKEIE